MYFNRYFTCGKSPSHIPILQPSYTQKENRNVIFENTRGNNVT